MNTLDRKLLRDLRAGRRQFLAVAVIVALGITLYVGSTMSYANLGASYERSYAELDFADFVVSCERAPESVVARARELPGVYGALGRWSEEISIEKQRGAERQLRGRVISLPDRGRTPVNRVVLRAGRMPAGPHARELLLEEQFARYHGYLPGKIIRLVVKGDAEEYRVVGWVSSPEYIIVVPNKEVLMPMPEMFGVAFMAQSQAQALLGEEGRINELCIRCDPGRRGALVRRVEALLKPYGGQAAMLREEQPSNRLLQDNLKGFSSMALLMPSLFLAVAGLTTYTLLTRLVHSQRRQIGLLRAEGLPSRRVMSHYLRYALIVGVVGGVAGSLAGSGLSAMVMSLYLHLYSIPIAEMRPRAGVLLSGVAAGMVCCLIGGIVPARAAMRLQPAEALRPEPPPAGRILVPERWFPALAALGIGARLPLRNLLRNPRRSLYTILGVASSVAIVLITGALEDGTAAIMDAWFHGIQRYDLRVTFLPPESEGIGSRVASWPGVRHVEPILEIPVEIEAHGRTRSSLLMGLPPAGVLMSLHDRSGEPVHVPRSGFAAGDTLRRTFQLEPGDTVRVRYPKSVETVRLERRMSFARTLNMPFGISLYAPLREVQQSFGERLDLPPRPITGLLISADARSTRPIRDRLYRLPNTAAVEVTADIRAQIDELLKFNWVFIGMLTAFGSALAFAIVYNTVSMAVLERSREIATLRTLGMRRREIALLVTAENLLVGAAGALLGVPLGIGLAHGMFATYSNEQVSMEFTLYPRTYAIVLIGIMLVLLLAQLPSLRHAASLDLARATKELGD